MTSFRKMKGNPFLKTWNFGDSDLQRNFIVRSSSKRFTERKTTESCFKTDEDLRSCQHSFYKDRLAVQVCQNFYLDTSSISQQRIRTAFQKVSPTGVAYLDEENMFILKLANFLKNDMRCACFWNIFLLCRRIIVPVNRIGFICHQISQFGNVMHFIRKKECACDEQVGSYDVFKPLNLSIHNPKKDQIHEQNKQYMYKIHECPQLKD